MFSIWRSKAISTTVSGLVKAAFADQSFLPEGRQLVAVNSINWGAHRHADRLLRSCGPPARRSGEPGFVLGARPETSGDIYAGYLAREMGLPIERLIVATNENDILHRFIDGNDYSISALRHTFSPSMDILVSSNFERYLFDLFGRDSEALAQFMAAGAAGGAKLSDARWRDMREVFDSASADDATTCATIAEVWRDHGVLLDPHTAVGVRAARDCGPDTKVPGSTDDLPGNRASGQVHRGRSPPPDCRRRNCPGACNASFRGRNAIAWSKTTWPRSPRFSAVSRLEPGDAGPAPGHGP